MHPASVGDSFFLPALLLHPVCIRFLLEGLSVHFPKQYKRRFFVVVEVLPGF